MSAVGRREQHKQETRRALQEAAVRLFGQDGYENTTVRDIAAAAGVTERTFFRYFATKEELVLGEVLDTIPVIQERVRDRPAAERPYRAVLNALLQMLDERDAGYAILFAGPPDKKAAHPPASMLAVLHQLEDALEEAFVLRPGLGPGLRAAVLAKASAAAIHSAIESHERLPEGERTVATARGLLQEAFDVLEQPAGG